MGIINTETLHFLIAYLKQFMSESIQAREQTRNKSKERRTWQFAQGRTSYEGCQDKVKSV